MAKLKHHGTFDSAQVSFKVTTFKDSSLEVDIGAARDMSKQEIVLLEQHEDVLCRQIDDLRRLLHQLRHSLPTSCTRDTLCEKGEEIANRATRAVKDRKWYSVSAGGLLDAAKAVGEAASPVVKAAINVIDLLRKVEK
jgi:hypothetical protein